MVNVLIRPSPLIVRVVLVFGKEVDSRGIAVVVAEGVLRLPAEPATVARAQRDVHRMRLQPSRRLNLLNAPVTRVRSCRVSRPNRRIRIA